MPQLNQQEETFARAVVRGMSLKNAAVRAGYSARSAAAIGHQLAQRPRIKQRCDELQAVITAAFVFLDQTDADRIGRILFAEGTQPRIALNAAETDSEWEVAVAK
jgi:phage terminase small subunit